MDSYYQKRSRIQLTQSKSISHISWKTKFSSSRTTTLILMLLFFSSSLIHYCHYDAYDRQSIEPEKCAFPIISKSSLDGYLTKQGLMLCCKYVVQGWVFATAKSIFARTVEKMGKNHGKNQQKLTISLLQ